MKKIFRYTLATIVIFFAIIFIFMICYKTISEIRAKEYLQSLSDGRLDRIEIYVARKKLEIYDKSFQQEILGCLAKIEPFMTTAKEFQAPGAAPMELRLFYHDGHQEEITLSMFEYSTNWGTQYFSCKIDGENALLSFPDPSNDSELGWKELSRTMIE